MPATVACKRNTAAVRQAHIQSSAPSPRRRSCSKREADSCSRVEEWRRRLRSIARVQIGSGNGFRAKRRRTCTGATTSYFGDVATPADLNEMRELLMEGEAAGLEGAELEELRQALEMEETKAEVVEAARLADLNEATSDIDTLKAVIQEGKAVGLQAADLKDAKRALAKGVSKAKLASADLDAMRAASKLYGKRLLDAAASSSAAAPAASAASASTDRASGVDNATDPSSRPEEEASEAAAFASTDCASSDGNAADATDAVDATDATDACSRLQETSEENTEAMALADLLEAAAAEDAVGPVSPGGSLLEAAILADLAEKSVEEDHVGEAATPSPSSFQQGVMLPGEEPATSRSAECTNVEHVAEFNRAFGIPVHAEPHEELFANHPQFVQQQIDLVLEEAKELEAGKARQSLPDVARALANLVYTSYSVGLSFGLNIDDAFRAVHASNMSTLCASEEEAQESLAWHRSQCPKGCTPPKLQVRKIDEGNRWMVQNTRTGEVLRSVRWQPLAFGAARGL